MLERVAHPSGVVFYRDKELAALGVRHAFSTRIGGSSTGPLASLNLGNPSSVPPQTPFTPDPPERIAAHFSRLLSAAGLPGTRCAVRQVHGAAVAVVRRGEPFREGQEADAIVSDDPDRTVVIRTADCAAVLMASADGRLIGAVHAGWRGVVAGAVTAAAKVMAELGRPAVRAAVFPAISADAFEVGAEVVEAFRSAGLPAWGVEGTDRGRADVPGACRVQLQRVGVMPQHCTVSGLCTYARADEFYSHRRDGGVTGRMALVAAAAESGRAVSTGEVGR
ncbi:MAG: polyphenol oxidase family protein [Tepidisphaerales bacterium]